jgi:hypothetical protein
VHKLTTWIHSPNHRHGPGCLRTGRHEGRSFERGARSLFPRPGGRIVLSHHKSDIQFLNRLVSWSCYFIGRVDCLTLAYQGSYWRATHFRRWIALFCLALGSARRRCATMHFLGDEPILQSPVASPCQYSCHALRSGTYSSSYWPQLCVLVHPRVHLP